MPNLPFDTLWLYGIILVLILIAVVLWKQKLNAEHFTTLLEQNLALQAAQYEQRLSESQLANQEQQQRNQQHLQEITALKIELAESNTLLNKERSLSEEKQQLLQEAKTALTHQFQALAGDILRQTGEQLHQQQQQSFVGLMNPFKENLSEFKQRMEELHRLDTTERTRLSEQVHHLMKTSAQVSEQTHALTKALTGQAKSQGDWGELVLERLLEMAGLIEGLHYQTQYSTQNDEGTRQRPDIVLLLPENKHLIIDSKVSLTAYTRLVNSEHESNEQQATQEHLTSVRQHILGLSRKNYTAGKDINSPDFVILFMPIESALLTAARADQQLYDFAWQHNVLLTSPSTLLFVLRMIGQLWRNAQQQQNVQDIIGRGEKLLDKLNGFATDLEKIGSQLDATHKTWQDAKTKFAGRGGLLSQAHTLSQLGVKPTKPLPPVNDHETLNFLA
jgi:DNA recombination protein RmuC